MAVCLHCRRRRLACERRVLPETRRVTNPAGALRCLRSVNNVNDYGGGVTGVTVGSGVCEAGTTVWVAEGEAVNGNAVSVNGSVGTGEEVGKVGTTVTPGVSGWTLGTHKTSPELMIVLAPLQLACWSAAVLVE